VISVLYHLCKNNVNKGGGEGGNLTSKNNYTCTWKHWYAASVIQVSDTQTSRMHWNAAILTNTSHTVLTQITAIHNFTKNKHAMCSKISCRNDGRAIHHSVHSIGQTPFAKPDSDSLFPEEDKINLEQTSVQLTLTRVSGEGRTARLLRWYISATFTKTDFPSVCFVH